MKNTLKNIGLALAIALSFGIVANAQSEQLDRNVRIDLTGTVGKKVDIRLANAASAANTSLDFGDVSAGEAASGDQKYAENGGFRVQEILVEQRSNTPYDIRIKTEAINGLGADGSEQLGLDDIGITVGDTVMGSNTLPPSYQTADPTYYYGNPGGKATKVNGYAKYAVTLAEFANERKVFLSNSAVSNQGNVLSDNNQATTPFAFLIAPEFFAANPQGFKAKVVMSVIPSDGPSN